MRKKKYTIETLPNGKQIKHLKGPRENSDIPIIIGEITFLLIYLLITWGSVNVDYSSTKQDINIYQSER